MKKSLLLLLSLLVAGSSLISCQAQALTKNQTECIKAISALSIIAGTIGYALYNCATQPGQVTTQVLTPIQKAQMAWMSMQPRFQQGAVNFQKATAFPFQGAFNLH